jgi:outer membrane cobalamin receptor
VERLAERGHGVVFSDDLIDPDVVLDLAAPSVPAMQTALDTLGLQLVRIGDHWVIGRAPSATTGVPRLRIRSDAALALEQLRVDWRGSSYPLVVQADGSYAVPLTAGTDVVVRAHGHRPRPLRLRQGLADVVLTPLAVMESVIVTGTRHRLTGRNVTGSLTTLTAEDLAEAPSLGGDAMRAAAELPGMSSVGVSAKPWIRGGLQDELLIRIDGMELLDAYHLADFQSLFSVVDDRSVAAVDVYTGGFPARYGNRMSGVMEIFTDADDPEPRTEIGISLFSLLANRRASVNDGATRYLGSVRRGNLDEVIAMVDPSLGTPRYHDAYGRLDHRLSETARLSAGTLISKDDVSFEEDETSARSVIDNRYLWNRLELDHGRGLTSSSTLTYTWSRRKKRQDDLDDDSGAGGFLDHRQALWKLGAAIDFSLEGDAGLMEFGVQAEYGRARYDSTAMVDRGIIGAVLGAGALTAHEIHLDPEGGWGGVYWAGEFPLGEDWLLQPGIRWDFQDFGSATDQLSPRLGLRYRPAAPLSLHLDVGRFHQPQGLHELQVADGEDRFFAPQRSDHYIVGFEWLISDGLEVSAEVYEKRYRHTKPRFENLFNPFVLVPELEPDRISVAPRRARARGADVELSYGFSERASAALRYSYMDAEDRLDRRWVPRRWSQRHTARAIVSWHGPRWSAALAATWHSGWRGADLPPHIPAGVVLDPADVANSVELDDFVSVDVGVRRTWQVGRSQVTASAGVTNLTDRSNPAGIEYDAVEEDGRIVLEREQESLLPLVPSVGVLITF